jgi:hypothetical protein
MSRLLKNRRLSSNMHHSSKSTTAIEAPSDAERRAFLGAIPPRLFGKRYLFAWHCLAREFILCETTEHVEDGHAFDAEVVPFN